MSRARLRWQVGEAFAVSKPRSAVMSVMAEATAIRPFRIEVPEEQLS